MLIIRIINNCCLKKRDQSLEILLNFFFSEFEIEKKNCTHLDYVKPAAFADSTGRTPT